jgi:general secretion pathway protein G
MRVPSSRGFTLIELVVTLALVGVMAMIAMPLAELTTARAKESELRIALRQIRTSLDAFKAAADAGQIEKMADQSGYPATLEDLTTPITNIKNPKGTAFTFLRAIPRDPFEPDASLSAAQSWNTRAYGTSADNPSPGKDVFDVSSRSSKVGLNGVPYNQW